MRELAIIADDLSSATDCGIQVAGSGLMTVVPLSWKNVTSVTKAAEVVSIDTGTRTLAAAEAHNVVRMATTVVVAAGFPAIFKSVDSTLRGNLATEIDAVLDVFDVDLAVVAPAYPLYGRTTEGGNHFLNGKLIHRTEFGTDPQCPVQESNLVKYFGLQSRRRVGLVTLDTLRKGNAGVLKRLSALSAQMAELIIFDAKVEKDLDRIACAVAASGRRVLWVGSTGLARCIPAALGIRPQDSSRPERSSATDRIMVVAGSASEITHKQLGCLKQERSVVAVEMDPLRVIGGGDAAVVEIEDCSSKLLDALDGTNFVALHVSSSRQDVSQAQQFGRRRGLTAVEVSADIVAALAQTAQQVVDAADVGGLVLTGGDTAKAVCSRLGAVGINVWTEVEPGVPLGKLVGDRDVFIVTKAGAFGTEQVLAKAVDALYLRS